MVAGLERLPGWKSVRRIPILLIPLLALAACNPTEPQAKTTPLPTLEPQPPVDPTPSETPAERSPTPTPTPESHSPTKLPRGMPRTFFAFTVKGDLVIGSTGTGGVQRIIATAAQLGKVSPFQTPSPSPDGRTLYYTKQLSEECREVWAIETSNGKQRKIAPGDSPNVNLDGTRLAYADSYNCGRTSWRIVVRQIRTGRERAWKLNYDTPGGVGPAAWTSDGRLLVDECGVDQCSPFILDPSKRGNDLEGEQFGPGEVDGTDVSGLSMTFPVVRGRRGTAVFRIRDEGGGGSSPPGIFEYTFKTKKTRRIIQTELDFIASDESGRFLLFLDDDQHLHAWYDGKSVRIGPGYASADW